jgi:hypothetical protein
MNDKWVWIIVKRLLFEEGYTEKPVCLSSKKGLKVDHYISILMAETAPGEV